MYLTRAKEYAKKIYAIVVGPKSPAFVNAWNHAPTLALVARQPLINASTFVVPKEYYSIFHFPILYILND
jgi:hypothetical protein